MTVITPISMMEKRISVKSESPIESTLTTPRTALMDDEPNKGNNNNKSLNKSTNSSTPELSSTTPQLLKLKKHKSRNGCITCKKKRLKCDETHPSCNNCTNKGIVCGGYTVAFKWKSFEDTGFKNGLQKKDGKKFSSVLMDLSASLPVKKENDNLQMKNGPRKMSRSLSSVDSDILQRALEDATLSVTGKTYREVAIANALIAAGRNPDLAAAVTSMLNERETPSALDTEKLIESTSNQLGKKDVPTENYTVTKSANQQQQQRPSQHLQQSNNVDPPEVNKNPKGFDPLESLATAAITSHEYQLSHPSPSAFSSFGNLVPDFFYQRNSGHSNLPSPGLDFASALMSPNLQEIIRGFENGEVGSTELLDSFNQNLIKNRNVENHLSPAPSVGMSGVASPRFSTLMRSFTNFDQSIAVASPANLDISAEDFQLNRKRRFSDISSFSSISQVDKRQNNNKSNNQPEYPSSVLTSAATDTDLSTSYEPLSPTNSNVSNSQHHLGLTPSSTLPMAVLLNDERMKMLAGFDRYTCGLMSIRDGNDNPWRTVMIPMAKEHSVLFNVFSAMTCFHIARGDEELRSQGIKYMRNTVVELARGLSDGSMQPEVALVTCLCLQNSETWDRQTSTGIAHLKGAKSMLIEILKNIQNGKKFLLDKGYEESESVTSPADSANVKKNKYGLAVDNQGKLLLQRKIPKNLLFLFNSFVYFDALARLTSESNDDIYGEKLGKVQKDDDSAVVSDDDDDIDDGDDTDSSKVLRRMKSNTRSVSPMRSPKSESRHSESSSTSFIELFNSINLEGHDIDPLLGCAHSLFPIIGKTAILSSKVKSEERNSLSTVSAAVAIKYELEQWRPPTIFNLSKSDDVDLTSCVSTAEAYRYAALIYLHQAVPEIPSKSSHELAEKVLMLLASIPNSSRTCITHIFPLLVASCEATPGDERSWVLDKWDMLIRKMWIGNIDRSLEIVKECWIRRDIMTKRKNNKKKDDKEHDGAEKLASKIAGYVASAHGERTGQEEDLSISGVKSWCHWRTIMKEWGWEVFLG